MIEIVLTLLLLTVLVCCALGILVSAWLRSGTMNSGFQGVIISVMILAILFLLNLMRYPLHALEIRLSSTASKEFVTATSITRRTYTSILTVNKAPIPVRRVQYKFFAPELDRTLETSTEIVEGQRVQVIVYRLADGSVTDVETLDSN